MKGKTRQAGLAMDIFELFHLAHFRMPNSPIIRQVEKLHFFRWAGGRFSYISFSLGQEYKIENPI